LINDFPISVLVKDNILFSYYVKELISFFSGTAMGEGGNIWRKGLAATPPPLNPLPPVEERF
jgi:hypothetical protein